MEKVPVVIILFVVDGLINPLGPIFDLTEANVADDEEDTPGNNVEPGFPKDLFSLLFRAKLTVSPKAPISMVASGDVQECREGKKRWFT